MRTSPVTVSEAAKELEEPLVRYATRILGDRERARDVVQDAFLKLHLESRAGSEVVQRPRRWLYTVCRNRALDILRQQKRMCALDEAALDEDRAVPACGFERRAAGEVVELFARLPDQQRRVLEMRFGEDRSYRSIGEATGISTGHVGYLIHDGIRALRRHLGVASLLLLLGGGAFLALNRSADAPVAPRVGHDPSSVEAPADARAPEPTLRQEDPAPEPAATAKQRPPRAAKVIASPTPAASAAAVSASASASALPRRIPVPQSSGVPVNSSLPSLPIVPPPAPSAAGRERDDVAE